MPFKPGKSPKDAAENVEKALMSITEEKLDIALMTVAYAIGGNADFYVPVDTNALMNSRATSPPTDHDGRRRVVISYGIEKKADYAAALHGSETYSPLWKPQPAGTPGKKTGGYNPAATPQWIPRGVADTDVQGIFAEQMKI